MAWIAASVLIALWLAWLVYRAFVEAHGVRGKTAIGLFLAGATLALPTRLLVAYVLDSLGWSMRIGPTSTALTAWLSATVVVAPIEHLVLVVVVWPLYRVHRLERLGTALSAAGIAAAGFSVVSSALGVAAQSGLAALFLAVGCFISRLFGAGVWSSCLATSHSRFKHWMPFAWVLGVVLDGFVRHVLEARGAGFQVVGLPPLLAMLAFAWVMARKLGGKRESIVFGNVHRLGIHVDGAGLESMRAAFQHAHRPALIHWILGGALVSFGANLVGLALGVFVAHAFAIDLSRVDETNADAMAPLLLLGAHVLLSFAIAGFLTAKASAADSLFEPGMAAVISIAALTLLLSRSAPVTIVLGLALSPVAFGVACVGAWLGLRRSSGA